MTDPLVSLRFARRVGTWSLLAVFLAACAGKQVEPSLLLQDFDELQQALALGYANLDWAADHHGLDLAAMARETRETLATTTSQGAARDVVLAFLDAFQDPHLRGERSGPPEASPQGDAAWEGPASTASASGALDELGYRGSDKGFGIDFGALDGFDELERGDSPFRAGVLRLESRSIGVIRIADFGEDSYRAQAAVAWEEFRSTFDGRMTSGEWWDFTHRVRRRLLGHLRDRIVALDRRGVDALLVDITGNGGGSEWCVDVARLFTTTPLVGPPFGMVRHEHWHEPIEREIERLEKDLARDDLTSEIRSLLEEELAVHRRLRASLDDRCDPTTTWATAASARTCERLAHDTHGRHRIPEGAAELAEALASKKILFPIPTYPEFVGATELPLYVAIDDGTASASEQFATLLSFNGVATIVGAASTGAGCGYTSGGLRLYLPNMELLVRMPDCMRVRADGENELAGIEPDLRGWSEGRGGGRRARELAEALR